MAAVFAQLIVGGEERGVHALLVPLRDERRRAARRASGSRTAAPSSGLDGVDNGRLWFDHVRVPRENLLDRYATVSRGGRLPPDIESPTKRFFSMLGTLIQGRVSVCGAAINASKVALAIAVRHARRAASSARPDGEEVTLMTYRTHQRRLLSRSPTPTRCTSPRSGWSPTLAEHFGEASGDEARRELETMAAGAEGGRHLARHRDDPGAAARRAAARATCAPTASPR